MGLVIETTYQNAVFGLLLPLPLFGKEVLDKTRPHEFDGPYGMPPSHGVGSLYPSFFALFFFVFVRLRYETCQVVHASPQGLCSVEMGAAQRLPPCQMQTVGHCLVPEWFPSARQGILG